MHICPGKRSFIGDGLLSSQHPQRCPAGNPEEWVDGWVDGWMGQVLHMLNLVALKKTPSVAEGHRPPTPRPTFLWRLVGMAGREERVSPLWEHEVLPALLPEL